MSGRRTRAYLVLVAVFGLGAGTGAAISYAFAQRHHAEVVADGRTFEMQRLRALARRLDLDVAQQERVRDILEKEGNESQALNREMYERCGAPLRDRRARVEAEIRAVLRPEQQERYDQMLEHRRRAWPDGHHGRR